MRGIIQPDGATSSGAGSNSPPGIFSSSAAGVLPPADGGSVAGIRLALGRLLSIEPMQGRPPTAPVLWVSVEPLAGVDETWSRLAAAFAQTGLWPVIIDAEGASDLDERLLEYPGGGGGDAARLLKRWWTDNLGTDEDEEFDRETYAPLGKRFPGLAPRTPGERPGTVDHLVRGMTGHLGLVASQRPADVLGATSWSGAANYDEYPADQSTVLASWEDRFDAYLVGLGSDTLSLAVARPPRDRTSAVKVAAEHLAFCPDNIWQGVGTVREYADMLVGATRWYFWWD